MRTSRFLFVVASTVAVLAPLAGCPSPVNVAPTADAGLDKSAVILSAVALSGAGADVDGSVTYLWTQLSGTPVNISNAASATAAFTAPAIPGNLTFRLTVTDNDGARTSDDVIVTITL